MFDAGVIDQTKNGEILETSSQEWEYEQIPLYDNDNDFSPEKDFSAIFFGVIHGFGFSNFFLNIVREDSTISNLIQFALGIEVAQIIIVSIVIFLNFLVVKIFNVKTNKIEIITGIIIFVSSEDSTCICNPLTVPFKRFFEIFMFLTPLKPHFKKFLSSNNL